MVRTKVLVVAYGLVVALAGWLVEVLSPQAAEVVVARVRSSRGPKSDRRDSFGLAEMLRRGAIDTRVFKQVGVYGTLRQLVKVHLSAVRDTVRTQSRLKALYRSRGVQASGKEVYSQTGRERWVQALPTSSQAAAEILYAEYDGKILASGLTPSDTSRG